MQLLNAWREKGCRVMSLRQVKAETIKRNQEVLLWSWEERKWPQEFWAVTTSRNGAGTNWTRVSFAGDFGRSNINFHRRESPRFALPMEIFWPRRPAKIPILNVSAETQSNQYLLIWTPHGNCTSCSCPDMKKLNTKCWPGRCKSYAATEKLWRL